MKKFAMFALMALLSLGLLTACGGGGPVKEVTVNMGENGALKFNPETLQVNKGEQVKVTLVNKDGAQAHSFIVADLNGKSPQVAAGKTETITFTASKSGEFAYVCDVPGHKEGGMVGKIQVK